MPLTSVSTLCPPMSTITIVLPVEVSKMVASDKPDLSCLTVE
jgi:hypothetical protein